MPYKLFTDFIKGKKKWCTKNLRTGDIVHYDSHEKRAKGIRIREAAAHLAKLKIFKK